VDPLLMVGAAGVFGAILVVVFTVAVANAGRSEVVKALAMIDRTVATGAAAAPEESFMDRVGGPFVKRLGDLGRRITPTASVARIARQLDYAGNPELWPAERLVQMKGVLLVSGGIAGLLMGLLYGSLAKGVAGALALGALGMFLPDIWVYNMGSKRQLLIQKSLADTLDMLTVSVEAGLGFDAALAQVAKNGKGPLAREMERVLQEMQIGKSRGESIRALGERTTVPELRTFCSAVLQASELGIPIAKVLREQSKEMRLRRRQRAEELAQKVPIKILFPMLFCLFPALFVVIIGPGALRMIHLFAGG
jgi:tight adherence protein C